MKLSILLTLCALAIGHTLAELQSAYRYLPVLDKPEIHSPDEWVEILQNQIPHLDSEPMGQDPLPPGAGQAINSQIVGGILAARGQFPWQVAVYQDNAWICGGSLISTQWVLTAAHCALGRTNFEILMATQNRNIFEDGRVVHQTIAKFVHPTYNPANLNNDIALLKLVVVVPTPTSYINVLRLPKKSDATNAFIGTISTISGWGKINDTSSVSPVLNNVQLPIIANFPNCTSVFGTTNIISSSLCASTAGAKSTCEGDSGGPLVYKESDGLWTQLGVVSFGSAAGCSAGYPVVFARVSSYLGWISTTTGIAIRPW